MNEPIDMAGRADSQAELSPTMALLAGIGLILVLANEALRNAASDAEKRHNRGELLRAYRNRHRWKASDRSNLKTLPVNPAAHRRLARLEGRGRPIVGPHRELAEVLLEKLQPFAVIANGKSTPSDRLMALKRLPWWPHFVESLYRGEYELSKANGEPSPSDAAEARVGQGLGISHSIVRRLGGDIRRRRLACLEDGNFPARTLADLQAWLRGAGANPWD